MNVADLAREAAVLKTLQDAVAERLEITKTRLTAAFAETGSTQAVPELPDGTKIATVTHAGSGGSSAYVASEDELMAWVLKEHPDQVELVIRDGYKKALMDAAKKAGQPVDPATGETVPGIAVKASRAYVSIRFKDGGRDAVAAAWRAGQLSGVDLVAPAEVEASEADEAA